MTRAGRPGDGCPSKGIPSAAWIAPGAPGEEPLPKLARERLPGWNRSITGQPA